MESKSLEKVGSIPIKSALLDIKLREVIQRKHAVGAVVVEAEKH